MISITKSGLIIFFCAMIGWIQIEERTGPIIRRRSVSFVISAKEPSPVPVPKTALCHVLTNAENARFVCSDGLFWFIIVVCNFTCLIFIALLFDNIRCQVHLLANFCLSKTTTCGVSIPQMILYLEKLVSCLHM